MLIFFTSQRNGRCRRAEGFLAQVLQRRRNHQSFRLIPIEVEQHPELVERFRVEEIPALVVVAGKRVPARLTRPRGCAEIAETLRPWLT